MLVHEYLEQSAARTPDVPALIEPQRTTTYRQLDDMANRVAHVLLSRGVRRGDRVVIALENCAELVACYFGAMKAGAGAVPLPPGARSDRLGKAIDDCQPTACVIDWPTASEPLLADALGRAGTVLVHHPRGKPRRPATGALVACEELRTALERVPAAPPGVRIIDQDLAAIIYTSGSTGEPRGAILLHVNISANTESIVEYLGLTANDRIMCVLPFYYVYGLSLLHTHLAVGGAVIIDNRFAFPNVVLQTMRQQRATGFAGVPSSFALLMNRSNLAATSLPDLRYVTQAGGGMAPARIQEWLEKGPQVPFFVMYGATEASARLTYLEPEQLRRKLGSIGRAIPNVEMRVVTDDGRFAEPREVGELVARGANISPGYWNDPEETAARFTEIGYMTGDLGYADEEGYLFLVGRRHDMLKVGAHRVGAKEIEDVLQEHPDIHEAAVVGQDDDILGEVPVAFVSLRRERALDEAAIVAFCHTRLAQHKVPVRFIVKPELPKSAIGKLDKGALRVEISTAVSRESATQEWHPRG